MELLPLIILGAIVIGGVWIHHIGIANAKADIKNDIANLKAYFEKKTPPSA